MDKLDSSHPKNQAHKFTYTPDQTHKKQVHSIKMRARFRIKWKLCFLFFITYPFEGIRFLEINKLCNVIKKFYILNK